MSEKITGAEALIRALEVEGVNTVFGYPGGSIIQVYDRLYDYRDRIHHILVRHEQGAVHAAQGYARSSGKTGVVIATSGPGATNVVTGVADAMVDSTPLVVITGQVDSRFLGTDAFQETDLLGITLPITKWACQVRKAEDIPAAVARAFFIASHGRPGPVVLDITSDAQAGLLEYDGYKKVEFIRSYEPSPAPVEADVNAAAELLNSAVRPMILVGQGVILSGAEETVIKLAEKADIPLCCTLLGLSAIPSGHRLYKGMLGMHGNLGPNINTNRADVILAVGMRFDNRVTGNLDRYAPDAKIIHVDIDSAEFNKNVAAAATIHADANAALTALLPKINRARHTEWLSSFDRMNDDELSRVITPLMQRPSESTLSMPEVIDHITRKTAGEAIVVTDVGQNQMWAARHSLFAHTRSMVTSGGLGTMGFGIPASIGAKVANPDRQVILYTGDGSFQMTIQELGTIMEQRVAVKIVILNNSFLGNVRQWQELFFRKRYSNTPMVNPDFIALCAAYGIKGENVENRDALSEAVDRMLAANEPYVLNVNIEADDNVFPMTPGNSAVDYILLSPIEIYRPND
jgi:acetolactate synthase-1/2/3 large subunit